MENYGQQAEVIINYAGKPAPHEAEIALLKAELWYCLHHEMVCNLQDFFVRRTGLLYFDIHKALKWKEVIAKECQSYFLWDETRTTKELVELEAMIKEHRNFIQGLPTA